MSEAERQVWLARHGETEWSRDGRHTGLTDIPLTDLGRSQAEALGTRLAGHRFSLVLTSPRSRATDTARLAGFADTAVADPDLAEWDYGDLEGRRTEEISADHPGWTIWRGPWPGGETVDQVSARADRVLARCLAPDVSGDVLLFGHGHMLRVLAARWLDLPAGSGSMFALSTATVSVLGWERERRIIETGMCNSPGRGRHTAAGSLRPLSDQMPRLLSALPHVSIDRHLLPNGLRIILSHDDRAPIVAVNLWYGVGSRHEKPGKTGFAHLFEHMMFQGSEHVAKGEHFALIQAAGGTANATTWLDRTNYFETLPSHELELALWLESDRLAGLLPAMTQDKLDNQRDVVKNERRWSVDNQPYGSWDEKLQGLLFPEEHPYHHSTIGSMEDLGAASLADVSDFFATHYAPNNAVLTIAGDFDPPAALALVEKHFGPIPANPAIPPAPSTAVDPIIGSEVRELLPDRVPLPRVYGAYRTPIFGTDGFDALEVVVDLLGSGRASRLYRTLVREQQLAQDVTVFPPSRSWAEPATFTMWVTARPGVAHEALEEALFAEVDRLAPMAARPMASWSESATCTRPASNPASSASASGRIGCRCMAACSTSRNGSTPR